MFTVNVAFETTNIVVNVLKSYKSCQRNLFIFFCLFSFEAFFYWGRSFQEVGKRGGKDQNFNDIALFCWQTNRKKIQRPSWGLLPYWRPRKEKEKSLKLENLINFLSSLFCFNRRRRAVLSGKVQGNQNERVVEI